MYFEMHFQNTCVHMYKMLCKFGFFSGDIAVAHNYLDKLKHTSTSSTDVLYTVLVNVYFK